MAEAIFNYEGINTTVQSNINDKMKDIIDAYLIKIQNKENNLYYLYNGTKINFELTFNEQANDFDKNRKKMNIIYQNIFLIKKLITNYKNQFKILIQNIKDFLYLKNILI